MKLKTSFFLSILFIVAFSLGGFAQGVPQTPPPVTQQPSFSDADLEKFSKAAAKVNEIQQSAEQQMMEAIQAQGLDVEKYNAIAQSQQDPSATSEVKAEDIEKFQAVNTDLQKIQTEMQPKMVEAIESAGMDIALYQEMVMAYQQSPEMQQKVQEMMEN